MAFGPMANMELDDEDRNDLVLPIAMPDKPAFPPGLRICLTHVELAKLGIEPGDIAVGDFIDLRAFATVTSVSINDGEAGPACRLEMQIERLKVENENTEEEGTES